MSDELADCEKPKQIRCCLCLCGPCSAAGAYPLKLRRRLWRDRSPSIISFATCAYTRTHAHRDAPFDLRTLLGLRLRRRRAASYRIENPEIQKIGEKLASNNKGKILFCSWAPRSQFSELSKGRCFVPSFVLGSKERLFSGLFADRMFVGGRRDCKFSPFQTEYHRSQPRVANGISWGTSPENCYESFRGPNAHPKSRFWNTKETPRLHELFEVFARALLCFPMTWVRIETQQKLFRKFVQTSSYILDGVFGWFFLLWRCLPDLPGEIFRATFSQF